MPGSKMLPSKRTIRYKKRKLRCKDFSLIKLQKMLFDICEIANISKKKFEYNRDKAEYNKKYENNMKSYFWKVLIDIGKIK